MCGLRTWGSYCKELIADNSLAFSPGNRFYKFKISIGFPLLVDSGNWHTATKSSESQRETYSHYWFNSGKPISAIRLLASHYQLFEADAPLKCINHIFWLKGIFRRKLRWVKSGINQ
jgi:hypothetical protein